MFNRLNRVITSALEAVKVELNTTANTFGYNGSMTVILPDGEDPNTIVFHWEQIAGTAVTFTSPLNEQTITFTAPDLVRKKFKVCTNYGSNVEQCAIAEFLHFPNEIIDRSSRDTFINVKKTNSISVEDVLPAYKQNGFVSIDPTNTNYATKSYSNISATADSYTIIKTTGSLSSEIVASITNSQLWEKITGTWTLIKDINYYVDSFNNVAITSNTYKIVYKYNLRGLSTSVTLPVAVDIHKGFSDRLEKSVGRSTYIGITNYLQLTQTSTSINISSTISNNNNRETYIKLNNYTQTIQTSTLLTSESTVSKLGRSTYAGIDNYSQSLQTSTGAT